MNLFFRSLLCNLPTSPLCTNPNPSSDTSLHPIHPTACRACLRPRPGHTLLRTSFYPSSWSGLSIIYTIRPEPSTREQYSWLPGEKTSCNPAPGKLENFQFSRFFFNLKSYFCAMFPHKMFSPQNFFSTKCFLHKMFPLKNVSST